MKYEFHVGDYVVLNNGQERRTGYVKEYKGSVFSNDYCFMFQQDDGTQFGWSGHIEELPHNITRIGQYNFIKNDDNKIEKLNLQGYLSTQTIASVVNELIETVNQLKEKVDEMA